MCSVVIGLIFKLGSDTCDFVVRSYMTDFTDLLLNSLPLLHCYLLLKSSASSTDVSGFVIRLYPTGFRELLSLLLQLDKDNLNNKSLE